MTWCELSARIIGPVVLRGFYFQAGYDPVEVGQDLSVHLGHACLAAAFGRRGDPVHLLTVLVVLRQELHCWAPRCLRMARTPKVGTGVAHDRTTEVAGT